MQVQITDNGSEERARQARLLAASLKQQRPLLDRRQAQRVPLELHVLYTSEHNAMPLDGEGRVRNLSKKGCHIVGTTPLAAGSRVTLSIDVRDGQPPLCLPGAIVCWTEGHCFSVKFPPLMPEVRYRVQQIVLKFALRREVSRTHTAFRVI